LTIAKPGMELERIGAPDDPVEGSNVTLICTTSNKDGQEKNRPKWFYHDNNNFYRPVILLPKKKRIDKFNARFPPAKPVKNLQPTNNQGPFTKYRREMVEIFFNLLIQYFQSVGNELTERKIMFD